MSSQSVANAAGGAPPAPPRRKKTPQERDPPRLWSKEEDALLKQSVADFKEKSWKKIAERVPNRNHVQCLQRWKKVLAPGLKKGQWTKEEDQLLIAHKTINFKNWGKLAQNLPGRTAKQCRERWYYNLNPSINTAPFTLEEDERYSRRLNKLDPGGPRSRAESKEGLKIP